jgi:uncharacterized Zn finger protein
MSENGDFRAPENSREGMARRPEKSKESSIQDYAKTWWGQRFLKAFEQIDFYKRLPRGRSFASNGAVIKLECTDRQIIALVKGSEPKPNAVRIVFPPFSPVNKKGFLQRLSEQPALISRLLKQELDPAILTIANDDGLKLFPEKWSDLNMQCSCVEWAVPCKHIAAVIYRMSVEIDQNPFLLFKLRGLDLVATFRETGTTPEGIDNLIPKMADLYPVRKTSSDKAESEKKYQAVALPHLPDLVEPVTSLMDPKPLFHAGGGDFRAVYIKQIRAISKTANRLLKEGAGPETLRNAGNKWRNEIRAHDALTIQVDRANHPYFFADKRSTPFNQISQYLFEHAENGLGRHHKSQRFLHDALLFSLQLLASGTIVPRIMQMPTGKYGIR